MLVQVDEAGRDNESAGVQRVTAPQCPRAHGTDGAVRDTHGADCIEAGGGIHDAAIQNDEVIQDLPFDAPTAFIGGQRYGSDCGYRQHCECRSDSHETHWTSLEEQWASVDGVVQARYRRQRLAVSLPTRIVTDTS